MIIKDKSGNPFNYRRLEKCDSITLGLYFENLSAESKSRFGPHPLTYQYAHKICYSENDPAQRFIALLPNGDIAAYVILDFDMIEHERLRYLNYGIELKAKKDVFFAPSVLDAHQNNGLASAIMKKIIGYANKNEIRSLVHLGGTQEPNKLALGFYQKFGFQQLGGYQTEVFNIDMRLVF